MSSSLPQSFSSCYSLSFISIQNTGWHHQWWIGFLRFLGSTLVFTEKYEFLLLVWEPNRAREFISIFTLLAVPGSTCQGVAIISANQMGNKWICVLVPKEKPIFTGAELDSLGLAFDFEEHKTLHYFLKSCASMWLQFTHPRVSFSFRPPREEK